MQVDQDKLRSENVGLSMAIREKTRKHQQTQELYDRLKRKEMTAVTQSAAFDSVNEAYGSVPNQRSQGHLHLAREYQNIPVLNGQLSVSHSPREFGGPEPVVAHERHIIKDMHEGGRMMPPLPHRSPHRSRFPSGQALGSGRSICYYDFHI